MGAEQIDTEFYVYLLLWLAVPVLLFMVHSRGGRPTGFVVYSYLIGFIALHWFGAMGRASPWSPYADSTLTVIGFRLATYALIAFTAGTFLAFTTRRPRRPVGQAMAPGRAAATLADLQMTGRTFLLLGGLCWLLSLTPVAQLPSASAILSAGRQCVLLGVCFLCWNAWLRHDRRRFVLWLGASVAFPLVTIATQGFIGYGISMMTIVLAFVAMFYRPRWVLLAGLVVMLYGGLTLWVNYAASRNEVRQAVWGGQGFEATLGVLANVGREIEPFDIANVAHLEAVDGRLNQNYLVGAAVVVTPNLVPYRGGETIWAAAASVIPRVLWPNKPATGGSRTYVSEHTLITFAAGTSIGMGQVLEFYINFGIPGVVGGFLLLGMALRYMDIRIAAAMQENDLNTVAFFFLVGSGALVVGGSLTEMTGSMAAGAVMGMSIPAFMRWRRERARSHRSAGHPDARRGRWHP